MNFHEAYVKIRPAVVAIIARTSTRSDFPPIIGTGVVIHEDGLILTNDHVASAISKLPRRKNAPANEWPAMVLFLHNEPGKGMMTIPIDIVGVAKFGLDPVPENYYGEQPDLAILHIGSLKKVPTISIASQDLPVGSDVGILGFPMGTDTLAAPGWIHQLTPTLQKGIVSAQLPFECEAPHALMIDAVTEGGSSGSPIFDATRGELSGILYGGLNDHHFLIGPDGKKSKLAYTTPTSHTLAISNFWIRSYLKKFLEQPPFDLEKERAGRMDFSEYLKTKPVVVNKPRSDSGLMQQIPASDIE